MLTGQLVFRDTPEQASHKGRKIMMVCGLIEVPDDWEGKGEHQYVVTGCVAGSADVNIHFDSGIDLTNQLQGITLDGMIKGPIWRV